MCLLLTGPFCMGGPKHTAGLPQSCTFNLFHHVHMLTSVQPMASCQTPASVLQLSKAFLSYPELASFWFPRILTLNFASMIPPEGSSLHLMAALVCASITPGTLRGVDPNHPGICSALRHADGNFLLVLLNYGPWGPNCSPDLSSPSLCGVGVVWCISPIIQCGAACDLTKEKHSP